jgi:small subunit ribosomal protein S20
MPITSSAKKALRVSLRKRVFNVKLKKAASEAVKEVRKLAVLKDKEKATLALQKAYKALDKAVSKKYIKKNTASRKKSRLAKLIQKI